MNIKCIYCILTVILLFHNVLLSQENSNYAILSGNIKNANESIELRSYYDTSDRSKIKVIHLKEDGSFLDTIHLVKEELYFISDKTNKILFHLRPFKKYSIEYDLQSFKNKGVSLKGDDIEINTYYIDKSRNEISYNFEATGKSANEIERTLQQIIEAKLKKVAKSNLPDELKSHEQKDIYYEYLRNLNLYSDNLTPKVLRELNIDYANEEAYKSSGQYRILVMDYYNVLLYQTLKTNQEQNTSRGLYDNAIGVLTNLIPNEYIKNDLIVSFAGFYFTESKNKESFYNNFKQHYTGNDNNLKAYMQELYNRFSKLKKGAPSPKFYNFKNYEGGVSSLDDFKGKYVFIDIWGTWCGNCNREIPALKKLYEEYENIVFLSIAWKDDEKKWREVVKRESLNGVQVYATKKDNTFFELYGVRGVPRYILIDPESNIIDHNTPRPSEKELKILFESIGM